MARISRRRRRLAAHKLRRITAALVQHPEARVIVSAAYSCSADLTPGPIWHAPKTDQVGDYRGFLQSVVTPSVVVLQKSVLDQVGQFDEGHYRAEDRELCLRIARAGFRFPERRRAAHLLSTAPPHQR